MTDTDGGDGDEGLALGTISTPEPTIAVYGGIMIMTVVVMVLMVMVMVTILGADDDSNLGLWWSTISVRLVGSPHGLPGQGPPRQFSLQRRPERTTSAVRCRARSGARVGIFR